MMLQGRGRLFLVFLIIFILSLGASAAGYLGYRRNLGLSILPLAPLQAETPSSAEQLALSEIAQIFPGEVLFDSNRSGNFGIYALSLKDGALRSIVDAELEEIFPDASPDGTLIVFARAKTTAHDAPSEIWLIDRFGKNERRLSANGTFPTFSADGKTVYFQRDRKQLIAIDLDASNERHLFPLPNSDFVGYSLSKPRVSADGAFAAFISNRGGRWHAWYAELQSGKTFKIGWGCEAVWFPSADKLAWVKEKGALAGAGIYQFQRLTGEIAVLQDDGPPRGHEYFPSISSDGRYLMYAACPANQHSHFDSNYQLMVKDLQSNKVTRLTFDQFTNRWPKLLRSP